MKVRIPVRCIQKKKKDRTLDITEVLFVPLLLLANAMSEIILVL